MAASKIMLAQDNSVPKWKISLALAGAAVLSAGIYYKYFKASKKHEVEETQKNVNAGEVKEVPKAVDPMERMKSHNSKGTEYFRSEKFEEAVLEYTNAIELCLASNISKTELPTIYQNRAAAHERLKNFSKVIEDCREAVKLNPRYVKALVRQARVAEVTGDLALALEDLTTACILEKFSNDKTMVDVDRVLKKLGQSLAKDRFGKSPIPIPSKFTVTSFIRGYCCDQVINDIQDESLNLDEATEGYLLAIKNMRNGEYGDVIELCASEVEKEESEYRLKAKLLRAIMYMLTINKSAAVEELESIYNNLEAPTQIRSTALVKHAVVCIAFNEFDEARELFAKAEEAYPENADACYQLGQMEVVVENIKEALEKFNKALELCPTFPIGLIQKYHCEYRIASSVLQDAKGKQDAMQKFVDIAEKNPNIPEARLIRVQLLLEEENYAEVEKVLDGMDANANPHAYVYRSMLILQSRREVGPATECLKKALELDSECEMALENLATINVQLGKLDEGAKLLTRAIPLSKCINEMAHCYSLLEAALAQINVFKHLNIAFNVLDELPSLGN